MSGNNFDIGGLRRRSNALIGERVHTLMWRDGRTQTQLAALLGVDQGAVSRRLHGRRDWLATDIAVTAAWLDVSPAELLPEIVLGGDEDEPVSAPRETRTPDLRIKSPYVQRDYDLVA